MNERFEAASLDTPRVTRSGVEARGPRGAYGEGEVGRESVAFVHTFLDFDPHETVGFQEPSEVREGRHELIRMLSQELRLEPRERRVEYAREVRAESLDEVARLNEYRVRFSRELSEARDASERDACIMTLADLTELVRCHLEEIEGCTAFMGKPLETEVNEQMLDDRLHAMGIRLTPEEWRSILLPSSPEERERRRERMLADVRERIRLMARRYTEAKRGERTARGYDEKGGYQETVTYWEGEMKKALVMMHVLHRSWNAERDVPPVVSTARPLEVWGRGMADAA